jgi:hypothetical protein
VDCRAPSLPPGRTGDVAAPAALVLLIVVLLKFMTLKRELPGLTTA